MNFSASYNEWQNEKNRIDICCKFFLFLYNFSFENLLTDAVEINEGMSKSLIEKVDKKKMGKLLKVISEISIE